MERQQIEEQTKNYINEGKSLFTVVSISLLRDGGTNEINTNRGITFYINKDSKKIHTNYPTSKDNLLSSFSTKVYLLDRIDSYLTRKEEALIREKNLYDLILKNY
jgi:hypothetical protein